MVGGFLSSERDMYELTYFNVMKGFDLGINMMGISPTEMVNEDIFRRAIKLWYIPSYSLVKRAERAIEYPSGVGISFRSMDRMFFNNTWKGFRGVFLLHPEINLEQVHPRRFSMFQEMNQYNERYKDQWQP
jgi:hypothetical protein